MVFAIFMIIPLRYSLGQRFRFVVRGTVVEVNAAFRPSAQAAGIVKAFFQRIIADVFEISVMADEYAIALRRNFRLRHDDPVHEKPRLLVRSVK